MNDAAVLLITIWEYLDDVIAENEKEKVAIALVRGFVQSGHEPDELLDAEGEFEQLDAAIFDMMDED